LMPTGGDRRIVGVGHQSLLVWLRFGVWGGLPSSCFLLFSSLASPSLSKSGLECTNEEIGNLKLAKEG